jgi:hypothetical protein
LQYHLFKKKKKKQCIIEVLVSLNKWPCEKKKKVSKNINQTKSNKKQQEKQNKNNLKYQLLQNRMYSNLLIDLNLYRRIYY